MTTEHSQTGLIGRSVRRVEDPVLITGKGCYVDDMQLPGMLHMAFLRSPYPHANILSIDTSAAQAMPGVVAVVTGDDLSERLHVPVMPLVPGMKIPPHPLLARGAVHAVGAAGRRRRGPQPRAGARCRQRHRGGVCRAAGGRQCRKGARTWRAARPRRAGQQHLLHRDETQAATWTRRSPRPSISCACASPARGWWRWRLSRAASWRSRSRRGISRCGSRPRVRTACALISPPPSAFLSIVSASSRPMSAGASAARARSTRRKRWPATWRCSSAGPSSGSPRAARISSPRIRVATRS